MKEWTFIKHIICSVIIMFAVIISKYLAFLFRIIGDNIFTIRSAASIAIISGADGPTAIYGVQSWNFWREYGEVIITFIILLLLFWPLRLYLGKLKKEKY